MDNDPGLLVAITARLESNGIKCYKAHTGAQGVAMLADLDFDMLITDLNMEMGDGISLATTFRRTCDSPIIIMTGFVGLYEEEIKKMSNVIVLEKPFESHQLVDTVLESLSQAEAAKSI